MFKLNKKEKKMVDLTIRPFLIFGIAIAIIVTIGHKYGTISQEEINGFIKAYIIHLLVFYINLSHVELKENMEKEKNETDLV